MRRLLIVLGLLMSTWAWSAEFGLTDEPDLDGAFEDLVDTSWWHNDWRLRKRIVVVDPSVALAAEQTIFLNRPDLLLLRNTARCRPDLGDLRVVLNGVPLPAGVVGFGADDDSAMLWCRLPKPMRAPVQLYLYYDNADAQPYLLSTGRPPAAPMAVEVGQEELRSGIDQRSAEPGQFFADLVVVEAERCVDDEGVALVRNRKVSTQKLWLIDSSVHAAGASSGAYLASAIPWRAQSVVPVSAWTSAQIPRPGKWQVHVRYRNSSYYPRDHPRAGQPLQSFKPFVLVIGDIERECGAEQGAGPAFRWDSFAAELPAGELRLGFRMSGLSGPDCVLFTQNTDYRPDCRDFTGPVWMRFRLEDESAQPCFIEMFCIIQPWSSHGPQGEVAAYAFADHLAANATDRDLLLAKADVQPEIFIRPGRWSPWIPTLHSAATTWWSRVSFFPAGRIQGRLGLGDMTVAYEFATRPDRHRVFRAGEEYLETNAGLNILMPDRLDWERIDERTLTFGRWAQRRFELVQSLGLIAGPRPHRIMVTTMARAVSRKETEYILKTCARLGFNGIDMHPPMPVDDFVQLALDHELTWSTAHHWHPKFEPSELPLTANAGETCLETLRGFLQEQSRQCYAAGPRWGPERMRVKLIIMGDEIGPATNAPYINLVPLLNGAFHEYLQQQGLSPEFFGQRSWDEVPALSYNSVRRGSEQARTIVAYRAAMGLPTDTDLTPDLPQLPTTLAAAISGDGDEQDLSEVEEARQAAERLPGEITPSASLEEKRLYHWTQRFRSYYSTLFYGIAHEQLQRQARELALPWKPVASPNFQAMPIMSGQMWDGALNLFEWARSGTTDSLSMEDWIKGPYRVTMGMRWLTAAARKRGQTIGHLIVADRAPRQRYLMALANGSRTFLSYLYGPLRVIGPAWAESEQHVRAWADVLQWTARFESELLASEARPAEAALLIANTSEINSAYLNTSIHGSRRLNERQHLFAALMDSQIAVELVGEEEIIEDDALARYKVLYVADPHVDSRAQQKIKAWVRDGGVLWGTHAALAREEYDVSTARFDDVFGLTERGPIVSFDADRAGITEGYQIKAAAPQLPAVAFAGYAIKPQWQLGSADVLARFVADGAPAMIHNEYGRGQAYLFGNSAYAATAGYGDEIDEPDWAAQSRQLVAIAATTAKVQPQVTLSHARVLWTVRDGRDFTLLVLANCFTQALKDLTVEIWLPRPPREVRSGRGTILTSDWLGDHARLRLDLALGDGEILLLRCD